MREDRPGERGPRLGMQDSDLFHTRTYVGQITSVKEKEGIAMIRIGIEAEEIPAIIPLYGLTVKGAQSSWGRYMPEQGAFVKCAYGPDDRLVLLGYDAYGTNVKTQGSAEGEGVFEPDIGGYGRLKDLEENNTPGLNTFRKLKGGEWDFRSSGNGYFHLSNAGHALLAGGLASINLDKNRFQADHEAGLITHGAEGTKTRLGDIKRAVNPLAPNEQTVPGATKEWLLTVATPPVAPAAPPLTMVDVRAGDVRDDGAAGVIPVLGPTVTDPALGTPSTPAPLRYRLGIFDLTGSVRQLGVSVDLQGHVEVSHDLTPSPKGLRLSGLLGSLITNYLKTNITSGTTTNIDASVAVLLGSELIAPINPVVLGTVWTTARATKNGLVSVAHATNSAYFGGATVAWAAIAAFMAAYAAANPATPIDPSGGVAAAAAGPLGAMAGFSGAAGAASSAAAVGITTFESGALTYLSLKTFTE